MLVPCSVDDIKAVKCRRSGKNIRILQQFLEMPEEVVEYVPEPGEAAMKRYVCFVRAAKRKNLPVIVTYRKGRIFFIKEEKSVK